MIFWTTAAMLTAGALWPVLKPLGRGITAVAGGVPALALVGYLAVGAPHLSDAPLRARLNVPLDALPLPGLAAFLETELARRPDDAEGWRRLAPLYVYLGRPLEAVEAYARAMDIAGADAALLAGQGEALVIEADGVVSARALALFDAALALDATHPAAAYYAGLAALQDNDTARASRLWGALLDAHPADAPWRARVEAARDALNTSAE